MNSPKSPKDVNGMSNAKKKLLEAKEQDAKYEREVIFHISSLKLTNYY